MRKINSFFHRFFKAVSFLVQLILAGALLAMACFAGFVFVKASQPVGVLGKDSDTRSSDFIEMSYRRFMADQLQASRQTPANCHRTRLIFLAVALPVYPALYTYVALYPESILARHVQSSPLIPKAMGWRDIPETWWNLVKEVTWLAFSQPLWDFTPAVGQRVSIDKSCALYK